jgi:hypothetical protein
MDLIDRILKSWKTSIAALVIAVLMFLAVYFKLATWTESSGWFVLALKLLFEKDSIEKS